MLRLGRSILYVFLGLVIILLVTAVGLYAAAQWTQYTVPDAAEERATVIESGRLFDGVNDSVREDSLVVVEGEEIACIGKTCTVPDGARRIDATGLTILPGLIDMHLHFDAPVGDDLDGVMGFARIMWSYVRHRPGVRRNLIEAGVTTVRSVGDSVGHSFGSLERKERLAERELAGPRLYTAGPLFTAPGGHPAGTIYEGSEWLIEHGTRQVDHPDSARAAVRALADDGVDGIKLVYDAGLPGFELPRLDRTVMEAIVDEARAHDLWVAAHTGSAKEVRHVIDAGVHTVEHGTYQDTLSAELVDTMADQQVVYVPTLAVLESLVEGETPQYMPDLFTADHLRRAQLNVRRAYEGDVPIGVGTDTQGPEMAFGSSVHRELELLVEAGLPPGAALRGATSIPGGVLDEPVGSMREGTPADLVLVSGRPHEEIEAIRDVQLVMRGGRVMVNRQEEHRPDGARD